MRSRFWTAAVSAVALCAFSSGSALAATVTILSITDEGGGVPATPSGLTLLYGTSATQNSIQPAPGTVDGVSVAFSGGNPASGLYAGNVSGSTSPFGIANGNMLYLAAGGTNAGAPGTVTVTWSTTQTVLYMLWGTVDGETGRNVAVGGAGTITGSDVLAAMAAQVPGGAPYSSGTKDVWLEITGLTPFTQVTFSDSATGSFEFALVQPTATTPLPASLPLFGGGLGVLALVLRRRKDRIISA